MQPSRPFLRTSHNNNLSRQQSNHDNNPRVSYFHSFSQHLQQHRACFCLSLAYEQAKRLTKGSLASAISDQFHRSTNSDPGCWMIGSAASLRFLSATYFGQSVSVFKNICPLSRTSENQSIVATSDLTSKSSRNTLLIIIQTTTAQQ